MKKPLTKAPKPPNNIQGIIDAAIKVHFTSRAELIRLRANPHNTLSVEDEEYLLKILINDILAQVADKLSKLPTRLDFGDL